MVCDIYDKLINVLCGTINNSEHWVKTLPFSPEINRIVGFHSCLLVTGQERIADLADLFSSVFQPTFVKAHFLI